ncbi:MAG: hypothetical protein ACI8P0_001877 [Planctomycetaceae bacterium]|jgi:hypothetical protein
MVSNLTARCRVFLSCAFIVHVAMTISSAADAPPLHELIDQHIDAALAEGKIPAADAASDAEFLRRVTLDLTGTVPTSTVARAFIENAEPQKREQLIDQLLDSKAFASHMATVFDVTLMERRPDKYVTTPEWRGYLSQSFAENKPLNQLVAEILGADGVDEKLRPAAKFYLDRAVAKDVLVRDIGRLFLGIDLQCAQCHDHPDIDDYLHQHYHGLSVFVAGSKTFKLPDGKFVLQEVVMREVEFASVFDPETTNKTGPRLLDALMEIPEVKEGKEYVEKPSRTVRSVLKFSLRKLLSEKLPSEETPEFARTMANRLWAMLMGRGIVHPLDMHHAANPPLHPELLDALSRRLVTMNFDVKAFLRELALSATYQRSSFVPEGVDPKTLPVESFAVANMKGLSPEQLFDSLLIATQASAILEQQIDDEIKEEQAEAEAAADKTETPDAEEPDAETIAEMLTEARRLKRAARVTEFVTVFGSVPGQPEGDFSASLPQALFLANSETVTAWVPAKLANLTERLAALDDSNQIADELFLSVLTRLPEEAERTLIKEHLVAGKADRPKAVAALVWSLLASAEFRLNH